MQTSLFDQPEVAKPAIPVIQARPYQVAAVETSLRALVEDNVYRQVVHMATGTGKTVLFGLLMGQVPPPRPKATKVLTLAHRDELIDQAHDAIKRLHPNLRIEVEQGDRWASSDADVIVASVPTLGREDKSDEGGFGRRLKRFNPNEFKMIWIDECHHVMASTYQRILEYFGTKNPDNRILLWGCSATPNRSDGIGLSTTFDEIVFSYGLIPAIEDGWLSRIRAIRVTTETNLSTVKVTAGDWNLGGLSDTIDNEERNEQIFAAWQEHCQGKRYSTMVFCATVAHVYSLIEKFREHGVEAEGADGGTNKDKRKSIVDRFRNREIEVLMNCALWTEGSDFPCMDALIMARPTQSPVLFTQILGRATRLYPGKEDALIIDMVDACAGKKLMTVPSLLGMDPEFDMEGEDAVKSYKEIEEMFEENPSVTKAANLKEAKKIVSEHLNLFESGVEDDVIREASRFLWKKIGDNYVLRMKNERFVTISQNLLGKYEIVCHDSGDRSVVRTRNDIASAINAADNFVSEHFPDAPVLLDRNAGWREAAMSAAQMAFFEKHHLRIPRDSQGEITMTKGEASNAIDEAIRKMKKQWHYKTNAQKVKAGMKTKVDDIKVGKI